MRIARLALVWVVIAAVVYAVSDRANLGDAMRLVVPGLIVSIAVPAIHERVLRAKTARPFLVWICFTILLGVAMLFAYAKMFHESRPSDAVEWMLFLFLVAIPLAVLGIGGKLVIDLLRARRDGRPFAAIEG